MRYANAWYWDGSLRDIYVLNITISDWQRLVDWLRSGPYPIRFYLNREPAPLPLDVSDLFAHRNDIEVLLKIGVEGIDLHCHFFWHKEIEFDLDPRDVDTEQKEHGIADFMCSVGRLLGKEVILTPEGWKVGPFLRYLPWPDEIVHYDTSIEPIETHELTREEGLKLMAKVYGVDENDERAIIDAMLRAGDRPAYEDD